MTVAAAGAAAAAAGVVAATTGRGASATTGAAGWRGASTAAAGRGASTTAGAAGFGAGAAGLVLLPFGRAAELADALAERLTDLGQLTDPKDQDDDYEDDDELWGPQLSASCPSLVMRRPRGARRVPYGTICTEALATW